MTTESAKFPRTHVDFVARICGAAVFFCCAIGLTGVKPCFADDPGSLQPLCVVEFDQINEASGLAISRKNENAVWIHNDSGDTPRLFLVGIDGVCRAIVTLPDAEAVDWEDMCSFEANGESWLLIGDIGDNDRKRSLSRNPCRLYLLKEPRIAPGNGLPTTTWNVSAVVEFEYEDGPWNCEGLAVDTQLNRIVLLTKAAPHKCALFSMPLNLQDAKQTAVARRDVSLSVPFATGIDISPDGTSLAIATMLNGLEIRRTSGQSWADAVTQTTSPIVFALPPRRQGETICFDVTGKYLFLNSEGVAQPLWRMPNPPQP